MGNVLNWHMPIEWDDGTGAWLDPAFKISETTDVYMVRSAREPDGWNRGYMPRLSATTSIMVNPDGTLDCARGSRDPKIQNVDMPILRFSDGAEPTRGTITKDGSLLTLIHPDGTRRSTAWPARWRR